MRNPVNRRVPRLFIREPGRYLPIFVLLIITIVVTSAFFIAQGSVEVIYKNFLRDGKVEDGQFTTLNRLSEDAWSRVEKEGTSLYENFSVELNYGKTVLNVHRLRADINLATLIEGRIPQSANEIALDFNYSNANNIKLKDVIELSGKSFNVTGKVVMPDYVAMIKGRNDIVMDIKNFGVGLVSDEGFAELEGNGVRYCYSYHENVKSETKKEANDRLKEITKTASEDNVVTDAQTRTQNKRISYLIDDMGGDVPMFTTLLAIIMLSIAFVFTVQSRALIEEESSVIGTLMASGYTKREMIYHYMLLPVLAVLISGVLGNVLTYTWLYKMFSEIYYTSFSLPPFVPLFNARAFLWTTLLPAFIIIAVNFLMLSKKLGITPLRFLRNDLSGKKGKKHFKLPDISFIRRFRIKVLLDNKLSVLVLLIGVTLANILLCFGIGFKPMFENYIELTKNEMRSDYQTYVRGIDGLDKEKFASSSFEIMVDGAEHPFTLNGISDESRYYDIDKLKSLNENEIVATEGLLKKFGYEEGDTIEVVNPYTDERYSFMIKGELKDTVSLSAYMPIKAFNSVMGYEEDYFSGYYSDEPLDIDDKYVVTRLDRETVGKLVQHFMDTFGEMSEPITAISVIFYFVFIYLLSKMIIEKSKTNICYLKIFGFTDSENASIYLRATGVIFTAYILATPWILKRILIMLMRESMKKFDSYLPPYLPAQCYITAIATGIVLFFVVSRLQTRRISKLNMVESLKDITG